MATTIVYPHCADDPSKSALPQLDIKYRGKVDSFTANTQMDTGETRSRQRYSLQKEVVSANLKLTHPEMDFWRNWVMNTLQQGTLSFLIKLPLGGSGLPDGGILVEREVSIVGAVYTHAYLDYLFHRVSFKLEFLDSSTLSPDLFSVYTDLGDPSDPCDTFDLAAFEVAAAKIDVYTRDTLPLHMENA